ncbi:MAG TPA: hypothetical protein VH877_18135 [Polyangia bacterium]|nr:hypothetical protein [Polyangia bacterium]
MSESELRKRWRLDPVLLRILWVVLSLLGLVALRACVMGLLYDECLVTRCTVCLLSEPSRCATEPEGVGSCYQTPDGVRDAARRRLCYSIEHDVLGPCFALPPEKFRYSCTGHQERVPRTLFPVR